MRHLCLALVLLGPACGGRAPVAGETGETGEGFDCGSLSTPKVSEWDHCFVCTVEGEGAVGECKLDVSSADARTLAQVLVLASSSVDQCLAHSEFETRTLPLAELALERLASGEVELDLHTIKHIVANPATHGRPELGPLAVRVNTGTNSSTGDIWMALDVLAYFSELGESAASCCYGEACGAQYRCVLGDWSPYGANCLEDTDWMP